MPKKFLASLEVAAIVNELQFLVSGRINQIYHLDEELVFQMHSKEGKQLLRIVPGKFLNLTKEKKPGPKPTSFCMQLRKYLTNAFIRKIEQKDAERIIIFELEKEIKYNLIIELFAPGNLVLTDEKNLTLASLHQQKFKDRFVKPKEKYVFPNPSFNWKTVTADQLGKILSKSEKKNLATSLATQVGFGGLYAEEICKRAGIDKDILPKEADSKEIIKTIKQIIKIIEKPAGFIYEEQITPFALQDKEIKEKTDSYNEAIDTLKPVVKTSPQEKKIAALKRIIAEQESSIKKQEEDIEKNNQKAELIYNNYQPLSKLFEIIENLKQKMTWDEVKKELQKEKKISKVDLKNKKIIVDL